MIIKPCPVCCLILQVALYLRENWSCLIEQEAGRKEKGLAQGSDQDLKLHNPRFKVSASLTQLTSRDLNETGYI